MPKQVIVIMDDHYPFGQCQESTNQNTRVLVRKIYEVSLQERNKLLEKASLLRKLKCEQLIKIQSVLQEQESIHFLYEYVPIRLQTWISNINDQFIENFRDQLIKFSSFMANNFIKIDFRLKNIGMDHNYGAKYFIDPLGFSYDPSLNKQRLKSQYIRDISNLFKPYIENNNEQQEKATSPNPTKNMEANQKKDNSSKGKNAAISPPTYNDEPSKDQGGNKTKQKLEKYYQQMNASMDVENQKILQQFMDVLDDQEEQEVHKPPTKNQAPQQARSVPPQYQYGFDPRQQQTAQYGKNKNVFQQQQQNNQYSESPKLKQQQHQQQQNLMMAPPKMTKNSQFTQQQPEFQEQVVWRDSDDLQNRIKKAIENSKTIIKRFNSIKDPKNK